MFLSFLSCSLFSYAANPRAVIVKCDGCAYDVDVDVEGKAFISLIFFQKICSASVRGGGGGGGVSPHI